MELTEHKPSLIVATKALREESSIQELVEILGSVYVMSKQRSLLIVRTRIDPYQAISMLRESLDPSYTNILKVIPVDEISPPYLDQVAEKAWEIAKRKIREDESFRVTLQGRLYKLLEDGSLRACKTIDSIKKIAENIDRRVDLENPDKIVYVRVVRIRGENYATITVCTPRDILSTQKPSKG